MRQYVVIILCLLELNIVKAPPPFKLRIDCSQRKGSTNHKAPRNQADSFCSLIHSSIPKAVQDGKFILIKDPDQNGYGNEPVPTSVLPPRGFRSKYGPRLRIPRIQVPRLKVPLLKPFEGPAAPKVGSAIRFHRFRDPDREESSAERMERFKKGVQKMLHVVKVLGQIDQYLSERTRIVVEKLARTFNE